MTSKAVSTWLRYNKNVSITDEDGETKRCQVAIAFHIEPNTDDLLSEQSRNTKSRRRTARPKSDWSIVPCEPGQVSIFFPAEKETSNLRFHLHAPFASTVARDSVRDCVANGELRDALAQLTTEALKDIRVRGLLTMSFLAVLPNKNDGLPAFYEPIRKAVVNAFHDHDLMPTKSGSHLKASGLYHGLSDISAVIDDDDLTLLTEYDAPLWAANAPQKGQREDKFIDSLNIDKWEWKELKESIQQAGLDKTHKSKLEKWIAEKPNNWLMRFYALMESCYEHMGSYSDTNPLSEAWKSLIGIRVIDSRESVGHVRPGDAFFPPQAPDERNKQSLVVPAKIRFVKPEVYGKGRLGESTMKAARNFLKRVGVRNYDERAEIERRLKGYSMPGEKTPSESHYRDIRSFISFLRKNPTEVGLFKGVGFLVTIGHNTSNETYWTKPGDAFLDTPYENTGLDELRSIHRKKKLWPHYLDHLGNKLNKDDFVSFLKTAGVFYSLTVKQVKCAQNNMINTRVGRETYTKSDVDWTIIDIEQYLSAGNLAASRLIWMSLIQSEKNVAEAYYRPNKQHSSQISDSQLVQYLKACAWIPDKQGHFQFPQDMTRDMLRDEFPYDDSKGLLTAIGFEEKAKGISKEVRERDAEAKKAGFRSAKELQEAIELLKAKREGRIQGQRVLSCLLR